MASDVGGRRNSNTQLLEELETLSQTLYQSHITSTRRTASLALPRSSAPSIPTPDEADAPTSAYDAKPASKPKSRRMSLSPWLSRPKDDEKSDQQKGSKVVSSKEKEIKLFDSGDDVSSSNEKKGIWKWKPIRALSHIGMQKLSCLFSVEVVAAQGLPTSMNGLRLSVCVRKKETKDGAVNTMPSRVSQGGADFEETLFVKCHVYCTQTGGSASQQMKFEPRPFIVYVFAVDAPELDFGRSSVDLSRLIQESMEKSAQGARVRQWDTSFDLSGKASGGQLLLKLAFQIMEKDGGSGLFNQTEGLKPGKVKSTASSVGRKQSKSSFSIPSPKLSGRMEVWTPSQSGTRADFQGIDHLNLDEPPEPQKPKDTSEDTEDIDMIPDFEIVDKGVEILQSTEETSKDEVASEKSGSVSSEVVKEVVVHNDFHLTRLTELDSLAQQIKALESMMGEENVEHMNEDAESQRLDAEEENVTLEFLQMLEKEDGTERNLYQSSADASLIKPQKNENNESGDPESKVFVPDLGKGLGCVVQTRNGGFLAATNPSNVEVPRKETPKLAIQISKPFVISSDKSISGFELFQRMASVGLDELSTQVMTLMATEELMGKTAEQVAFEGIASAIINGRNKEGASSTAARSLATVKKIASAMSTGRKERVNTGIWNVPEDPIPADEVLPLSMQKIEAMAIDALKIQADIAEDDAPFDVSPLGGKGDQNPQPLASAIPLDDWIKNSDTTEDSTKSTNITVAMVIQLRDPLRRFEAVGGPLMALINATPTENQQNEEDTRFKVTSLHIAGIKVQTGQKKNAWDTEKHRLTAMQWLLAYGMGKAGKKSKSPKLKGHEKLWSMSSRVVADMWLKSIRNPDIKFTK